MVWISSATGRLFPHPIYYHITNQLTNHIKIVGYINTAKLHRTLFFVMWNLLKRIPFEQVSYDQTKVFHYCNYFLQVSAHCSIYSFKANSLLIPLQQKTDEDKNLAGTQIHFRVLLISHWPVTQPQNHKTWCILEESSQIDVSLVVFAFHCNRK